MYVFFIEKKTDQEDRVRWVSLTFLLSENFVSPLSLDCGRKIIHARESTKSCNRQMCLRVNVLYFFEKCMGFWGVSSHARLLTTVSRIK